MPVKRKASQSSHHVNHFSYLNLSLLSAIEFAVLLKRSSGGFLIGQSQWNTCGRSKFYQQGSAFWIVEICDTF